MGGLINRLGQTLRQAAATLSPRRKRVDRRPRVDAARRQLIESRAVAMARLALSGGNPAAAEQALERAKAHGCCSPRVTQLAARIALQHGEAARAMAIIESADRSHADTELTYQLTRCMVGERDGALLDLISWSRRDDCPPMALVLAAWLCSERGDHDGAQKLIGDPRVARHAMARQLAIALHICQAGQLPSDEAMIGLLYNCHGHADSDLFARTLGLRRRRSAQHVPLDLVERLAGELVTDPQVIPTLVAGQRLRPRGDRLSLIRRALVRVVDELPRPIIAVEALAELARLAGDVDDAWRWAKRGLRLDAYNARLAMLASELVGVEEADAQPRIAREALQRITGVQPDWPDVRRALAARCRDDGDASLAIEHLYRLLIDRPNDPAATAMLTELAA